MSVESTAATPEEPRVYTVSRLNRAVTRLLKRKCENLFVEGEASDVRRSPVGHVYFTLNDEQVTAQLKCVLFRGDARRAGAPLENGARLRLRGDLTLYEQRGVFQMIVREVAPLGEGELKARFEKIKQALEAEGLFDPNLKRPIPRLPRVVGVVTSEAGAALRDVIRVAHHRCPTRLVVADCRVQGEAAVPSVVAALEAIQRLPELDVVIVTRGGGSAEDLWAFNEEPVARAIAACRVPTVVGIGHETDVTIAELVADARAATPSNAAELVVPDRAAVETELRALGRRLHRSQEARLDKSRLHLERLGQRLGDPRHHLLRSRQRLADALTRATAAIRSHGAARQERLAKLEERLGACDPRVRLRESRRRLDVLGGRLRVLGGELTHERRMSLERAGAALHSLSPLAVLERGYAIALHESTGKALTSAKDATVGDALRVRLARGELLTEVREVSTGAGEETP